MTTSPVQLMIFDGDGVLVDSERLSNRIFAGMLSDSSFIFLESL